MGDHCYADRDQFWRYVGDLGADENRADDLFVLGFLQGASRSVDAFCRRTGWTHIMSGFGPRFGTSYYDTREGTELDLDDDLLALTSLEVALQTGGTFTPWVDGTDFLLVPYDRLPQRRVVVPDTSAKQFMNAHKAGRAVAKWGYADVRSAALQAKVATGGWTADATFVSFTDTTELALGQTLWCETEAIYLSDLNGLVGTVVRGAHGTTKASHAADAALYRQVYDSDVMVATIQLALRRWKHRSVGLSSDYGGVGGLPPASEKAAEDDTLRALIGHLSFRGRT